MEVTTEDAYRMAMKSMLKWVGKNMDPKKTRVFFTSMSPTHAKLVTIYLKSLFLSFLLFSSLS